MLIIETNAYIAGIFADAHMMDDYMTAMPIGVECLICNADLHYPFWIVETKTPSFVTFQTHDEALEVAEFYCGILYTIEGDYRPNVPWADEMGSLPHQHVVEEDT